MATFLQVIGGIVVLIYVIAHLAWMVKTNERLAAIERGRLEDEGAAAMARRAAGEAIN